MPKYSYMISKAVDLVARKLAGMDSETVGRLTQILSEEAKTISEELQYSGQPVNSDILAARLEGVVARLKYEMRNQGPDPSPHEFPIFNVSHNPEAPYPNPINHLYDKRYKQAYSTFIKQKQPVSSTSTKSEPTTPTSPASVSPSKSTVNPQSASHRTYPQNQYQQQSTNFIPNSNYYQEALGSWQYMNPYATMPRSHAAYYQQQGSNIMQPTRESSYGKNSPSLRRSSTVDDARSRSLSRSASSNDLNYATDTGREKIRVRVINDNIAASPSSADPNKNSHANYHYNTKKSILKPTNDNNNINKEVVTTRKIYTTPNTQMGTETMQDLFKVVQKQQIAPTGTSAQPMTERVIIIDRRGISTPDKNGEISGQDRVRTFEIRSSTNETVPVSPSAATTPSSSTSTPAPAVVPIPTSSSNVYALQQPNYYSGQQLFYQQPRMYMSVPAAMYSNATPYDGGANSYYPYTYYQY